MRSTDRKQPAVPDSGPCGSVIHKLSVQKQTALVVAKVRERGFSPVPLIPDLQCGVQGCGQVGLNPRGNRRSEKMFTQAKDNGSSFWSPSHILNPIGKSSPEFRV